MSQTQHNQNPFDDAAEEKRAIVRQDVDDSSLRVLISTQLDKAISTSRAFPRRVDKSIDAITTMATHTAQVAAACRFRKPVGEGKFAEGGSIRLAEICFVCWGNIDVGAPMVTIGERHVEAHVLCQDLQTNARCAGSCTKSIMYSKKGNRAGGRFGDDQIAVAVAAACAIAKRNAILGVVPRVFWEPVLERCKAVAAGDIKDLKTMVAKMFEALKKRGIDEARVLAALERESITDVTAEDVVELQSIGEAVKSSEMTLEEAFPVPAPKVQAPAAGDTQTTTGKPDAPKKTTLDDVIDA